MKSLTIDPSKEQAPTRDFPSNKSLIFTHPGQYSSDDLVSVIFALPLPESGVPFTSTSSYTVPQVFPVGADATLLLVTVCRHILANFLPHESRKSVFRSPAATFPPGHDVSIAKLCSFNIGLTRTRICKKRALTAYRERTRNVGFLSPKMNREQMAPPARSVLVDPEELYVDGVASRAFVAAAFGFEQVLGSLPDNEIERRNDRNHTCSQLARDNLWRYEWMS
jgi:hypothetical protein